MARPIAAIARAVGQAATRKTAKYGGVGPSDVADAAAALDAVAGGCSAANTGQERCSGVARRKISIRSVTSARTVRTKRSAKQFARGHRGGIFTIAMPASAMTASSEAVN